VGNNCQNGIEEGILESSFSVEPNNLEKSILETKPGCHLY
jgi:hypothetical protein